MTGFQNFMLAVCFGVSAGFLLGVTSLCISAGKCELQKRKASKMTEADTTKETE